MGALAVSPNPGPHSVAWMHGKLTPSQAWLPDGLGLRHQAFPVSGRAWAPRAVAGQGRSGGEGTPVWLCSAGASAAPPGSLRLLGTLPSSLAHQVPQACCRRQGGQTDCQGPQRIVRALGRLQRVSVQPPGEADPASDPDHASCWLWGLRPVAQPLGVSVSALAVLWVSGEGFSGIR